MTVRKEVLAEGVELHLGDCLEVLPTLGRFDAVVTDPPYGVGAGNWGSGLRKSRGRKAKTAYAGFDDTPEYIAKVVVPAMEIAISNSRNAGLTPGFKNMWLYPPPAHVGSFQYPGSTVMSAWGPALWQPVFYYGKDPYQGRLRPDSFPNCNDIDVRTDHPCPKPLGQWMRLVDRVSRRGDLVCDPFMGSGTTGVAAVKLGRRFTGIEIDPGYFDIACRRIEASLREPDMFIEPPAKPEQLTMLEKSA